MSKLELFRVQVLQLQKTRPTQMPAGPDLRTSLLLQVHYPQLRVVLDPPEVMLLT